MGEDDVMKVPVHLENEHFDSCDVIDAVFEDVDAPLPNENFEEGLMSGSQKLIFKSSIEQYCARWNSESQKIADVQEADEFAQQLMLLHREWKEANPQNYKSKKNKNVDEYVNEYDSYDDENDEYSDVDVSV